MIVTRSKSNVRETWRVILVSEADIFFTESLRILAERLSQSKIGLPLRLICYDSPPEEVGVFSTEIKQRGCSPLLQILPHFFDHVFFFRNDFLRQFLYRCRCCRVLMQITVQRFYAHVAAVCNQIRHGTV